MERKLGLTTQEAEQKLKEFGYNELREVNKVSPVQIFLRQVKKNFILYLLAFSAILSLVIGKVETSIAILIVICIMVGTGFVQEFRAEKAVQALKGMILPITRVFRNGKEKEINSREIVPDDVILLRAGERVPSDCVVIDATELKVNEAVLTGESIEVDKHGTRDTENHKRENMIFMGTFIVSGKCTARVLHTGMNTEFGKIANMISTAEKTLPLQKKINNIAKYMSVVAVTVSLITGTVMIVRNVPLTFELFIEVLTVVIALSVSAFPEGFPIVLITTLASGAYRMAKKNAIVNRMSIIETLGETTVICTDKTGTITKGEMTVKSIYTDGSLIDVTGVGYESIGEFSKDGKKLTPDSTQSLHRLLLASVLCNDAHIEKEENDRAFDVSGSATEAALLVLAAKGNVFKEDMKCKIVEEIPFSSERKFMSSACVEGDATYVYAKGAPEVMLAKCTHIQIGNEIKSLTEDEKKKILDVNGQFAKEALRALVLAYKKHDGSAKPALDTDLVFLGIVGMEDPPREEVKKSLETCYEAGIKVKMITGDNRDTAEAIGRKVGLTGTLLTGAELEEMTDEELYDRVEETVIFARVKPEHKLRIVKALKARGEIVTMTGDGVNDAPALKEAHIGVAMGKNGTEVSREASDLILKDDNFSTMVVAVEEGRTIFSNIRKFVTYQLSDNFAELSIILIAIVIGLPLPLIALQILFLNLVTDDMPAITLGFNPASHDVMRVKPRRGSNILNKYLIGLLITAGSIMAFISLSTFYYSLHVQGLNLDEARTVALVTLVFMEIASAYNFRSFRTPFYKLPFFSNKYLAIASFFSLVATAIIVYTPVNSVFGTAPIGWHYWLIGFYLSIIIIVTFDAIKILNKKFSFMPQHL